MSNQIISNPFFDLRVEDVQAVESRRIIPRKAIYNAETDELVSVVSKDYKIIENKELVDAFEKYLVDSDVKFIRTGCGTNRTGSKFWANYRFPEIKTNVGDYMPLYGTKPINDDIELMMDILNSYDTSSGYGTDIGGLRKVCLNGLKVKEQLYKSSSIHAGDIDYLNEFVLNFETAKNVFINDLAKSWEELTTMDFDKVRAATVLRALDLGKTYANKLGYYYNQQLNNDHLKTMWDFYNMITWFTTHVVEERSRQRARNISLAASQMLIGSDAL